MSRFVFVVFPFVSGLIQWMVVVLLVCTSAHAQWLNYPEPGVPRGRDGKVNLFAPVPLVNGKPTLSGVWMHDPTPREELDRIFGSNFGDNLPPGMNAELQSKYGGNLLIDFEAAKRDALLRPQGVAARRRLAAEINSKPPDPCGYFARVRWEMFGWPQMGLLSEPIKIVQGLKETLVLYEVGGLYRQIFTDGREFPSEFNLPAYLGYSIGRWEDDTFVVETRGFRESYLDSVRHPRSAAMHITERFRRRDFGHLEIEMTFEDPEFYTQPFSVRISHTLVADNDIFEMFCENEKDAEHLKNTMVRVAPEVLSRYAGTYEGLIEGAESAIFQFRLSGDSLIYEPAPDNTLKLRPLSRSAFTDTDGTFFIRFEEQDGVMRALIGPDEERFTRKR